MLTDRLHNAQQADANLQYAARQLHDYIRHFQDVKLAAATLRPMPKQKKLCLQSM